MKKLLATTILFVMVAMLATTIVTAATNSTLPNELYAIGSKYGMKESDKLKMEKYLNDYPLSDDDCNEILALANQADKIMQDNNTTNYKTLPNDVKAQLKSLANQAAAIAGVTLDFKTDRIDVYKDGKLIEAITDTDGKLPYTGNEINVAVVVSSIAVIALAATGIAVATKKRLATNA